ncbi:baseplate assembly protein [Limimaricola hongkongensis]|uniref:Baseplate assembly protein J n=1 Tax=Limimaricola hongkongensis DSM 17492 TaxID=1122180 RepID=A0A017HBQ1_9RHOB|nr:baseplate J/gp47 family protein [Limimaricola hongkongensis]EYD71811.1 Baseplate assembly protein J [Limimaricola hongkongensis DSM 17492]
MTRFSIDISKLPFPGIIESLDYEEILAGLKIELEARYPLHDLESDPIVALLEVVAYYRLIDRARINDAAKAVFIAYASGADLDNLGAFFGAERITITPEDTTATPPVAAVMETDDDFRARILLALEAQSTAGPRGAYLYHALSADSRVLDAAVIGPGDSFVTPPPAGQVDVYVLGRDGSTPADLLDVVRDALNDEEVRPLCDTVTVSAASLVDYAIDATLTFYKGPDQAVVLAAAQDAVETYVTARFRLGQDVTRSGIFAALHQPGVQNVTLTAPAANIVIAANEAPRATMITLTNGGVDA